MSLSEMIPLLLKPLMLSLLISFVLTPPIIFFFRKKGWLEDPKKEKRDNITHQEPIPRGGGISIFVAVLATSLLFISPNPQINAICIACAITLIVGLLDDLYNLNPYLRLATNLITALIVVGSGISIKFITNPAGGIINLDTQIWFFNFSQVLTIIWILWCMNIIGWSAGVEGQLPGFVAITSLVIGFLSLRFSQDIAQWPVIILAGATAGAYLGFLPFNFFPQKIMPGYSGKSLAGFLIAILAILSGAKLATVILTLGVPMVDGVWTIIRRLAKRKIPVWGDAEHLHHLFLKAGLSKPAIAVIYWFFSAVLGLIVLNLNSKQKLWAFLMVSAVIAALITGLRRSIKKKNHSNFSA